MRDTPMSNYCAEAPKCVTYMPWLVRFKENPKLVRGTVWNWYSTTRMHQARASGNKARLYSMDKTSLLER